MTTATLAPRRESLPKRLKTLTPFSRYNREDIETFVELVGQRHVSLLREVLAGDMTASAEAHRLKALIRKLKDDLKMRL